MDKYLRLKEKFDNKEKIVGTSMTIFKSTVILDKMAKREDIDFILYDCEHGIYDAQDLIPMSTSLATK